MKEPCPNCKETEEPCACMRNICYVCLNPVGNITFTLCDDCWDKAFPKTESELLHKDCEAKYKEAQAELQKYKDAIESIEGWIDDESYGDKTKVKEIKDILYLLK